MAIQTRPPYNLRNPVLPGGEKFMGAAEQVRPATLQPGPSIRALPAPAPVVSPAPTPGAANMMGSGSAPIGAGAPAPAAGVPSRMAGMAGKARTLANGALGKVVVGAAAAQAVGDSMAEDSTARFAKRFGVAEPTGDGSLGDIAKFAGIRAGGFASDLGNRLTGGLAGKLYADNPAGAAQEAPGGVISAGTPETTAQGAQTAQNAAIPVPEKLAGTDLGGGIRRVLGNEQKGVPLFTNATSNAADYDFATGKGGTVSTIGNLGEANATNARALEVMKQIRAMKAGQMDNNDISTYAEAAGQQPGGVSQEVANQIRRLSSGGGRLSATANQTLTNLLGVQAQLRNQEIDSSDRQTGLAQNARLAGMTARQKQMQDDREFGLKQEDLSIRRQSEARQGGEASARRENENFKQSQDVVKGLNDRYATQFRDAEGKVDTARVAKFSTGVQTFVGERIKEYSAKQAAGTLQPDEAKMLAKLQSKGIAALDEEDLTNIETNIKRGERTEQSTGKVVGGKYIKSLDPNAYAVKSRKQNLFGSDTLILNNDSELRENDAMYTEPGNDFLPDVFKTRTDEFNIRKGIKK